MREIKDYLHLYMGCDVAREHKEDRSDKFFEFAKLVGVSASEVEKDKKVAILDVGLDHFHEWYVEETKPVLRQIDSLTEVEAVEIAIIMHGKPDSVKWRMQDCGKYFSIGRNHYVDSFTIDKASGEIDRYQYDSETKASELQTTLNHHLITFYMISKGFDLFGLIDSGLAIEKSKL